MSAAEFAGIRNLGASAPPGISEPPLYPARFTLIEAWHIECNSEHLHSSLG